MPYFRHLDADCDPHELLDPANHFSTPWGEPGHGPCDKCEGECTCEFRCLPCLEEGADPECPACEGRVEYVATCPTCLGDGQITNTRRRGVSAFPSLAGLYRYLVEREFDFAGSVIVEFDGDLSDEPDLDAETGAVLVHPTEIVTRHAIDEERIRDLRARLGDGAR